MSPSAWTAKRFVRPRSSRPGGTPPLADCWLSRLRLWWARKKPTNAPSARPWHSSKKVFTWAAVLLRAGKNYMNGRTFVDTNVLIYAHHGDAKSKHTTPKTILPELCSSHT